MWASDHKMFKKINKKRGRIERSLRFELGTTQHVHACIKTEARKIRGSRLRTVALYLRTRVGRLNVGELGPWYTGDIAWFMSSARLECMSSNAALRLPPPLPPPLPPLPTALLSPPTSKGDATEASPSTRQPTR